MKYGISVCLLSLSLFAFSCNGGSSTPAPTPTTTPTGTGSPTPQPLPPPSPTATDPFMGSYPTSESEYHLASSIDNDVLPGVATEDWAEVYRPTNMGTTPLPVIVMLHGNHSTCAKDTTPLVEDGCQYTFSGTCPTGDIVLPNHLGYEYLATRLASFGYFVISINANLGITCGNPVTGDSGLVLARGRLILRHLALLSAWNKNGGTPSSVGIELRGKLDLTEVGLFGHSRAGEGIRAAYNLYSSDPQASVPWTTQILGPVVFRGLFEVGPVDGQSSMVLNASGTSWNTLLPICDGDVVALQGMLPYDRMLGATAENPPTPKSMYAVWGANHDFYNTEWQTSESAGCAGSAGNVPIWTSGASASVSEQETAVASVIPFFRAHVGPYANPTLAESFDPLKVLPEQVTSITRVDRTYTSSPNLADTNHMETFSGGSSKGTSGQAFGTNNVTLKVGNVPEHDASLMAGELTWSSSGVDTYFQDNWTSSDAGIEVSADQTLDFRVSRNNSTMNPAAATNFQIQLVYENGVLGNAVSLSNYFSLLGPVGSSGSILNDTDTPDLHETLPTIRIPLTDLIISGNPLVTGVRFTFNGTATGDIFISSIDLVDTKTNVSAADRPLTENTQSSRQEGIASLASQPRDIASLPTAPVPVNRLGKISKATDGSDSLIIEVESDTPFPVRNALPVLHMNGKVVGVGFISTTGELNSMFFEVKNSDIAALPAEFSMDVGYREDPHGTVRSLGTVQKSAF